MEFGFVYRVTLRDRANPPGRYQRASDLIREWFEGNGVHYGMSALGGSRAISGAIYGRLEQELDQLRERFATWLVKLPVCASAGLGHAEPIDAVNLMDDDWERTLDINGLTEQDYIAALAYHMELEQRVKNRANGG